MAKLPGWLEFFSLYRIHWGTLYFSFFPLIFNRLAQKTIILGLVTNYLQEGQNFYLKQSIVYFKSACVSLSHQTTIKFWEMAYCWGSWGPMTRWDGSDSDYNWGPDLNLYPLHSFDWQTVKDYEVPQDVSSKRKILLPLVVLFVHGKYQSICFSPKSLRRCCLFWEESRQSLE